MDESMAIEERRMIDEAIVERRETGGEVPDRLFESLSTAHRSPDVSDEDDYEDT